MSTERVRKLAIELSSIAGLWSDLKIRDAMFEFLSLQEEFNCPAPHPTEVSRPLTRERIEEALRIHSVGPQIDRPHVAYQLFKTLSEPEKWICADLPDDQPQAWIKPSDRQPKRRENIYVTDGVSVHAVIFDADGLNHCFTHWQPRYVPAPPVQEESELVRLLRQWSYGLTGAQQVVVEAAISEVVKRHEAKGGAK